jgi:hypothetical protein
MAGGLIWKEDKYCMSRKSIAVMEVKARALYEKLKSIVEIFLIHWCLRFIYNLLKPGVVRNYSLFSRGGIPSAALFKALSDALDVTVLSISSPDSLASCLCCIPKNTLFSSSLRSSIPCSLISPLPLLFKPPNISLLAPALPAAVSGL